MNKLILSLITGYARHTLTTIGGAMVSKGIMTNAQSQQIIGAILVVVGLLWSNIQKAKQHTDNAALVSGAKVILTPTQVDKPVQQHIDTNKTPSTSILPQL